MRALRFEMLGVILALPVLGAAETPKPATPEKIEYAGPKKLCVLANGKINESSGLGCSRLGENVFWTHNDSGDTPRIYAFNTAGEDLGSFHIKGARAIDWEDMASFRIGDERFLLLADVGDNARRRKTCELYIVPEPLIPKSNKPVAGNVNVTAKIVFEYEDGPHNCESVAVDPTSRKIYLATKGLSLKARVYELPLVLKSVTKPLTARAIAKVPIAFATAMDISPDGLRAVILTYGAAYEFTRRADQTWSKAFGGPPRPITMPPRRQGESICYGPDGKTLYLTSEQLPTPLWLVPLLGAGRRKRSPTR